MEETFAVGLRVGERALVVVRWGVRLLRRHHLRRRVAIGHGAHARRHGCSLQAAVPHARGITQGILKAQEIVDKVRVASVMPTNCDAGWNPRTALRVSRA